MIDHVLTHLLLTSVALSLHDAIDLVTDVRDVRAKAHDALPDVDPALVEDLLISAVAKVTGAGLDVEALTAQWGAAALHHAAPRLVAALDAVSGHYGSEEL